MGSALSNFQPEELAVFKSLPPKTTVEIPERPENRVPTDRKFLIVFGVFVVALLPFLIYTLYYSDIHRIFRYYDQCGNICGKINGQQGQFECSGQDFTNKRLLELSDVNGTKVDLYLAPRLCVSECSPGYDEVSGYCLKRNYDVNGSLKYYYYENNAWTSNLSGYLNYMAWRITLACSLSLAIGFTVLFLFRMATVVMVWGILAGVLIFLAAAMGGCWYLYTQARSENSQGFLVLAIFATVMFLILLCLVVFFRKKIALVIVLLKESMKATFAMPRLFLVPVLVLIAQLIILGAFTVTTIYMSSAGILAKQTDFYLIYRKNFVMIFAIIFNGCITIWAAQFVTAINYMVVAGAVSKWYFARDKNHLDSPIVTSTSITFKFHLGSVAFGSMIITIIVIIRSILSSLSRNRVVCFPAIERFVKFLSKNAYLLTAMHGQPFFKSGKRAVQIIIQNVVNIAAVNFIGNFILFMAHLLVVLLSVFVTFLVMLGADGTYIEFVYLIVVLVSIVVAAICFSIFETAIDTIFLCFCEDCTLNDGMSRPYAMSTALMEFMDNSKTIFAKKKM
ncbi:choline transporter-like protein 1 [Anoplophora glabripennis]|uniref:choline transporter-like protein 1 n=1 Tax=Anoplophora glabripennis TaxID=217634 RepID=UPI000873F144|nr:choline transporter-like protein 1 [Anoplophora glabripennis]